MKKIKIIWKNKWHIIQGMWYNVFKKAYIEKIAAERLEICAYCPDIDLDGVKCMMPGTQPCCGKCGCSLDYKVRDLTSSCGNEENPLWKAIEKSK